MSVAGRGGSGAGATFSSCCAGAGGCAQPATSTATARKPLKRGKAREMVVGVGKAAGEHGQAPEAVAHLELLAHSHAAVQLHCFLADVARAVGDLDLGGGHGASPVFGIFRRIDL